ncbi:ankyrin repeat domain-containing protein [Pseudoxanthomonas winnipegensis]|uniref:ankyrin repeat domain-containing protein n=1 Tax=Pseudoxanthomonas winnipegensis TaxID=2480810 RepID=UPI00103B7EBF|nr:ankyrin repeat domain-containing protein [Pseudoxanthomonas winnipegensis]
MHTNDEPSGPGNPAADQNFLYAACRGNLAGCERAINDGAFPNAATDQGDTALHLACAFGHAELVPYLVSLGVDANAQNRDGLTPMHECVIEAAHPECLAALLATGQADTAIRNKAGMTPEQCVRALQREVELLGDEREGR